MSERHPFLVIFGKTSAVDCGPMAAVVSLKPKDDRGVEILDELEARIEMKSDESILEDGTRRYYLSAEAADVDAFNPMLDKIDSNWRDHVDNWWDERS